MSQLITSLITIFVVIHIALIAAAYMILLERKVCSWIQDRIGPNRVGPKGLLQPIADGLKLFVKEEYQPPYADKVLFVLAPALILASILGAMVAFPLAPDFFFADLDLGVFMILALSSTTTIGVVMAGWSSNSKWSLYGAMREAAQVVAISLSLSFIASSSTNSAMVSSPMTAAT